MKKILLAVAFLLSLSAMSFAQSKEGAKKPEKQAASQKPQVVKKEKAATDTAKKVKPAVAPKAMAAGPMKKDGTPDKRYKENKESAEVVHKKKDGTPDKRFKENKKKS